MCLDNPFIIQKGMRLMQDGAISHTARTTLILLQAHRVIVLPWSSKSPGRYPIEHILDGIGRLEPIQLHQFIKEGWNGIAQRMLNIV